MFAFCSCQSAVWSKLTPVFLLLLQPADHPEADHYIDGFDGWKKAKGKDNYLINVMFVSETGNYENYTQRECPLPGVYTDCEQAVNEGNEKKNFLVGFAQKYGIYQWMPKIASLAKRSVTQMFPTYSELAAKPETSDDDEEDLIIKCGINHVQYEPGNYAPVYIPYYFENENKWWGAKCRECKKKILSEDNLSKPTSQKPCYVCSKLNLEPTDCMKEGFVCHTCYMKKQLEMANLQGTKRSTRRAITKTHS